MVLAITVGGGHGLDDLEALALAGIVGVLAFLTWVWTDRSSREEIARRADERLGLGGALLAAFENASRPERPMAELGAKRALVRASFARLRTATVPPFEIFLVLPLLGGIALFRAIETRDDARPIGLTMMSQVNAIGAGLQRTAAAHPGELSDTQMAELDEAMGAAQAAAQGMAEQAMGEAMRDVAEALDEAAASLPDGSALGEKLERLAFEAEAASVDTATALEENNGTVTTAQEELAAAGLDEGHHKDQGPGEDLGGPAGDAEGSSGEGLGEPQEPNETRSGEAAPAPEAPSGPKEGAGEGTGAPSPESQVSGSPSPGSSGGGSTPELDALDPTSAAPAPWWPDRDDGLVRAWLAQAR